METKKIVGFFMMRDRERTLAALRGGKREGTAAVMFHPIQQPLAKDDALLAQGWEPLALLRDDGTAEIENSISPGVLRIAKLLLDEVTRVPPTMDLTDAKSN